MLKSRIPKITATLNSVVQAEIKEGLEMVADGARSRVPIASGDLYDSIEVDGNYVVAGEFYGFMVEFGTVNTAPQPFLVPALEANRAVIVAAVRAVLRSL